MAQSLDVLKAFVELGGVGIAQQAGVHDINLCHTTAPTDHSPRLHGLSLGFLCAPLRRLRFNFSTASTPMLSP